MNTSRCRSGNVGDRLEHLLHRSRTSNWCSVDGSGPAACSTGRAVVTFVQPARQPPLLPGPALQPVQAGIDENPHEPHIERQFLAVLLDVQKHLDERVLDGFVGVGGVAQIVIRDAQAPALQQRHQGAEPIARRLALAGQHQAP